MAKENIAAYLNDHLAGSIVAIELLEHLEEAHAEAALKNFFSHLRKEIKADHEELKELMSHLKINESTTRKASASLSKNFTKLKLWVDDPSGGDLRLFESLEFISLGIEGKKSLWLALKAATNRDESLKVADYDRLIGRASEQREQVEEKRIKAALNALPIKN